jgi:hypothetical protein
MSFESLLHGEKHILSQGSVYELLRRSPEVEFDEHIFHAGLIYDPRYAAVLERVYRSYIDTALTAGMSVVVGTATRIRGYRYSSKAISGRGAMPTNPGKR